MATKIIVSYKEYYKGKDVLFMTTQARIDQRAQICPTEKYEVVTTGKELKETKTSEGVFFKGTNGKMYIVRRDFSATETISPK